MEVEGDGRRDKGVAPVVGVQNKGRLQQKHSLVVGRVDWKRGLVM